MEGNKERKKIGEAVTAQKGKGRLMKERNKSAWFKGTEGRDCMMDRSVHSAYLGVPSRHKHARLRPRCAYPLASAC